MAVSATMRELISATAPGAAIARRAQADGTQTLRRAALERVLDGTTSLAEALCATEA
jgi:type IV pilus assembly protein PilB